MTQTVPAPVITAAQAAQRARRVPASVSIAQWALESGWGAKIPPGSFNPFGIKARAGEPFVTCLTHEVVHGQSVLVHAAFRKFESFAQAFDRHAELLAESPVYAAAMASLPSLERFVAALAVHYATDRQYAAKLLNLIAANGLRRFDAGAANDNQPPADLGRAASLAAFSQTGA